MSARTGDAKLLTAAAGRLSACRSRVGTGAGHGGIRFSFVYDYRGVAVKSRSLLTSALAAAAVFSLATPAQADDVGSKDLVDDASAIMELTYAEFAEAPHDPPFDWSSDGCSSPLPSDPFRETFRPACDQHDFGYRNFGNTGELKLDPTKDRKKAIDQHFREEMERICADTDGGASCMGAARAYFLAVRQFGDSAFFG